MEALSGGTAVAQTLSRSNAETQTPNNLNINLHLTTSDESNACQLRAARVILSVAL